VIRSVDIQNFRGIASGTLGDLTPLTVLVGPNGSGKSSVLEAIYAANDASGDFYVPLSKRRHLGQNDWKWLRRQPGNGSATALVVSTVRHDGSKSGFELDWSGKGDGAPARKAMPYSAPHKLNVRLVEATEPLEQGDVVDAYTRAVERGALPEARAIAQGLLPDVTDVQILAPQGKATLYLVYPRGAVPVSLAGEGVRLLLHKVLELSAMPGGIVLLEEPETHLHPAGQWLLARAIWTAVRRGIQVILTTHSLDLIDALLAEPADDDELAKLTVFRLLLDGAGTLRSTRIAGPDAQFARSQIEDDLR